MAAAANACVNAMSSGTVNIRNSGAKNGTISIKSNITLNGNGTTISGGGTVGLVYAQNSSSIGAINIKDPIPLHISAFGPKGRMLTARLGAGWINGTANVSLSTRMVTGKPR